MPWSIETTGLWYNKSLIPASTFKKGTKLTWKELLPKLQKLTTGTTHGFAMDLPNFYYDYAFISGFGGYVFKFTKSGYDWRKLGLDTPGAIKGIQFIKDLTTNGKYKLQDPNYTYDQAKADFMAGKLAVFYTGPWERENFVKAGINFGFAPLPSLDGKHPMRPFSGVQVYSVNAYSKHKNEAFALLSFMTREMQAPEVSIQGRPPVLKTLFTSKSVTKDPVIALLAKQASVAQPMPNIPEMGQVWDTMKSAVTLVIKNQMPADTAAHQAVTKIKSDIAKARGG
jgi:arabinogalactan oligomer/maltooligosaccharide transport system substrate-binding protein